MLNTFQKQNMRLQVILIVSTLMTIGTVSAAEGSYEAVDCNALPTISADTELIEQQNSYSLHGKHESTHTELLHVTIPTSSENNPLWDLEIECHMDITENQHIILGKTDAAHQRTLRLKVEKTESSLKFRTSYEGAGRFPQFRVDVLGPTGGTPPTIKCCGYRPEN